MHFSVRRLVVLLAALACTLGLVGVVLAAPPAANFMISDTVPQVGQTVQFESSVTDPAYTYDWDFGDGSPHGSGSTTTYAYGASGPKDVTLTITDPVDDQTTSVTQTLRVNAPPTASFSCAPPTVAQNEATTCTASASDADGGVSYAWDANNDGSFDPGRTDPIELFSYTEPGLKPITLRITDSDGATTLAQGTVTVTNRLPTASLTVSPNPARINAEVEFDASASSDQGGSIDTYQWDLDGNVSTGPQGFELNTGSDPTTTQTYTTPGSRAIRVRVVDNNGGTAVDGETLFVVNNAPPVADLRVAPNPAQIGDNVSFVGTDSSDSDGTIIKFEWDLDGDGNFERNTDTTRTTTFAYTAPGTRTVALRVTDNDNAVDTAVVSLRINARPSASFSLDPNPALLNETVVFDAATSEDPDGSIRKYEWDLDGDVSTGPQGFEVDRGLITSASRSYTTAGPRTIRLRVTDNNGATTILPRQLTVQLTRPNAAFSFAPQAPVPGQAVALTSQSTPSGSAGSPQIASTEWDFDYDPTKEFGADALGANTTTSFANPGAKTVAIKVTETGGGFDIASGTVVVNAPPQASFGASGSFLDGDSITLSSTSGDPDGPLAAQQWDLDGDGQYDDASGAVASRAYPAGSYTARLRVTDSKGATATAERRIDVLKRPLKLLTGVKVTLFGDLTRKGVRLKGLLVRTPAKATAKVTCKGRKCPKGARAASKRTVKTKRLRFKSFERSFPAGTLITVTVTRPGYIGQYTTIKVRKGLRRYVRRDRCLAPGSRKPIACPDS